MSFLPAVQREIQTRQPGDPARVILEYLLQHAVGWRNAVSFPTILAHIGAQLPPNMSREVFQQTILAASRDSDYFIGSSVHGYFLIDAQRDAEEMRDFYVGRIAAERRNLANLIRQARAVPTWNIAAPPP